MFPQNQKSSLASSDTAIPCPVNPIVPGFQNIIILKVIISPAVSCIWVQGITSSFMSCWSSSPNILNNWTVLNSLETLHNLYRSLISSVSWLEQWPVSRLHIRVVDQNKTVGVAEFHCVEDVVQENVTKRENSKEFGLKRKSMIWILTWDERQC